jgi:uroporphyrinogen-III synthase
VAARVTLTSMRQQPLRVWITRAQPGAAATAERVRALGHAPIVLPLLVVEPLAAQIDLSGVGALAFTSVNGVRAFAAQAPDRGLPAFAVGAATARAAREAGFAEVTDFDGDVSALAEGLAARAGAIAGAVLHPGAAEPAGDLAGALVGRGVVVRRLALYRTRALAPPDLAALDGLDAALVHSPKGGAALAAALSAHPAPGLKVFAISVAALRPLAQVPLAARASAARPREADLLDLLAACG